MATLTITYDTLEFEVTDLDDHRLAETIDTLTERFAFRGGIWIGTRIEGEAGTTSTWVPRERVRVVARFDGEPPASLNDPLHGI